LKLHTKLLLVIAAALFAFAHAGCETPYQRERVLRSVRVEYGLTDADINRGKRDWGMDGSYVALSFAPFAGIGGPDRVIVEATHAAAEAGQPPGPVNPHSPCGGH
jgi:hypothetical protein